MLKGFRDFVLRGNVMDLAVAVVIGAAFTRIVGALVKDIINPLIAAIFHQPNFASLVVTIHGGKILYGSFLNEVINFILIAAVVYFVFVVPVNKLMARLFPAKAEPAKTMPCPECMSDIPIGARRCAHCAQPVVTA